MGEQEHGYRARLVWEGNLGTGTARYDGYGRQWRVQVAGKPDLVGSADPQFRGAPELYNPEDLLVAALSSCHLLAYLALCAKFKVRVVAYEDEATGSMRLDGKGGGRFTEVLLRPRVTIAAGDDAERAQALHERAHASCFIAASVNFPVRHEAQVVVATTGDDAR